MPKITRAYTRTGDDGTTGLAAGERVPKDSLRIEAIGSVDELNAVLGIALASGLDANLESGLSRVQNDLFHLGAMLCVTDSGGRRGAGPRIEQKHVEALEKITDRLSADLPPLQNFILPGGSAGASALHWARTVCRRVERRVVALNRKEAVEPAVLKYLNRLSGLLSVAARQANRLAGTAEVFWDSRA